MTTANLIDPSTLSCASDSLRAITAVLSEYVDAQVTPHPDVLEAMARHYAALGDYLDTLCMNVPQ